MLFRRTRRLPSRPRKTTPERCVFAISGIAGPGLPRSVALRAAELGNIVAGWDIDVHGGQRTVDEIRSQGGTAHFFHADATRLHQVRTVLQEVVKLGPIAALVNLVGKAFSNDIDWLELEDDDFLRLLRRTFRVNAQSAAIAAREVLPRVPLTSSVRRSNCQWPSPRDLRVLLRHHCVHRVCLGDTIFDCECDRS